MANSNQPPSRGDRTREPSFRNLGDARHIEDPSADDDGHDGNGNGNGPRGGDGARPARRPLALTLFVGFVGLVAACVAIGALLVGYMFIVMRPNLPSLDALTDYQPKVPLRVYTADQVLIGEFGEERRSIVRFNDIPDVMKKAVLAIEDYRFYEHGGVDFVGILRAGVEDVLHHGNAQGASTITMQVARNFFLSSEKTYTRKVYEMMLAYKIESALSKDQILELYMNQIYLGQRAYGFAAASRVYFGKDLKDITLAQAAMLAGLPKAPSAYNPIVNPKRAKIRQAYILKRMLDLRYITQDQYDQAIKEPIHTKTAGTEYTVHAEYIAEMVRQIMYAQYKEDAYTRGLTVTTTIDSGDQEAAYEAVRKGIMDYERRHGYRGPEAFIDLPPLNGADSSDRDAAIDEALNSHPDNGELVAAVVTNVTPKSVDAELSDGNVVTVQGDGLKFAAAAMSPKAGTGLKLRPGAIIRLAPDGKGGFAITQLPQVEGALVSLTPQDGAIRALIGGFDFNKNKFNHVTQAWRQPGSSFKPFIYSSALEKGVGPATIVNDAPLHFPPAGPGQDAWDPKDDDQPDGPMPLRLALEKSKNLVSIRLLGFVGTKYAQDYVTRNFGFDADKTPPYLPMALGAGLVTPLQSASAYAVFANGGYRVNPYLISSVGDVHGNVLSKAQPVVAGQNAPRTISAANDYIMTSLLRSVAQAGTGAGTNALHRTDLAGKTGTTNEAHDGWFAGFQHSLVAVAWMGYDQPKSLGSREFGAQLALPIWVQYMGRALRGVPQYVEPAPDGVSTLNDELYLSNFTPGNGFITSIGLDDANPFGASGPEAAASAPVGAEPGPNPDEPIQQPPAVSASETNEILDLFKHR
ncbi:penicillin-binding protein 1A [Pararobbsia silviterrae]|uniref:Penicillin-binding protein 1A n=1 Tax=Pararobbsia silviterrae TaxID=1792498 RepID=A0A494Y0J5_9BURK|nr:penicillin-binding protein 1A [Pararobbsia silviterrae]RKP54839.1 penicillin-binding protein 1A [Pararobbsia silviterrae]